jgi:hypothetical protein
VFLFCQQHAREWATGLTCLQTAHELVENYATDPQTKQLLDNVEVFISPNSNPDGAHYSMYDASVQRKTMVNYCPTAGTSGPDSRTTWGVDMNRNSGEYSPFDGYFGAAIGPNNCTSEVFAGPGEYSEPETRNEAWVVDTFPNIKFMNNIHSYGGYFMWAPGSYKDDGHRTTAPAPNIGIEQYFFEAGEKILKRIKDSRGTVILPQRTGPIADVLYSAAGNSADDGWYRKGIIAYSFETGADRMLNTSTGHAGHDGRLPAVLRRGRHRWRPGQLQRQPRPTRAATRRSSSRPATSASSSRPTTTARTSRRRDDARQRRRHALLSPINYRFTMDNEPSVIHYTTTAPRRRWRRRRTKPSAPAASARC